MLRFAADENFNNDILRGVLRRNPESALAMKGPVEIAHRPRPLDGRRNR
jgi:hypothetical protein